MHFINLRLTEYKLDGLHDGIRNLSGPGPNKYHIAKYCSLKNKRNNWHFQHFYSVAILSFETFVPLAQGWHYLFLVADMLDIQKNVKHCIIILL